MRRQSATLVVSLVAAVIVFGFAGSASAQLMGHYLPGFTGVEDGTQPPPSITLVLPVYVYRTDTIKDDNGDPFGDHPPVTSAYVLPGFVWVSNLKLFGGNWGGQILPVAYTKGLIEGPSLDVPNGFKFGDIYVQPFQLGWSKPRADFVAGWSFFVQSGEWELGGDDNGGLGMLSNLFQAGTTVRLDSRREWSVSVLGTYEINSHKREGNVTDTHIRVGDIMTVEGGFARSFHKRASGTPLPWNFTVGIPYFAQFKVTTDTVPGLTSFLQDRKDRVFGAGVEGRVFIPKPKLTVGLRVIPEFGAIDRAQGTVWMFTFGYRARSFTAAP